MPENFSDEALVNPASRRPEGQRPALPASRRHPTRWLTESEVADLYRNRFHMAEQQTDTLAARINDVLHAVDLGGAPWIVVGLVPTSSRDTPSYDLARVQALDEWARRFAGNDSVTSFLGPSLPHLRIGLRRVGLTQVYAAEARPSYEYAELHTDGSGAAALRIELRSEPQEGVTPMVLNEWLLWATAKCLYVLGQPAVMNAVAARECSSPTRGKGSLSPPKEAGHSPDL